MKFSVFPLLGAGLLALTTSLPAQDGPPVNASAILRELDSMQQRQKATLDSAKAQLMSRLASAAQSDTAASNFYQDAVVATQFEGQPNKVEAFSAWKNANGELLRDRQFQEMVLLHLKYLMLSLQRANLDEPDKFVAPSLDYVTQLAGADLNFPPVGGGPRRGKKEFKSATLSLEGTRRELLDSPLGTGIFVKWLRLEGSLPSAKDWELKPGDLSGILEKNVRPVMRKTKNPKLIDTWDQEMRYDADLATQQKLDFSIDDFNSTQRPRLLFSRAKDMFTVGFKNKPITEIYSLIQTYPAHPDHDGWVIYLRDVLTTQVNASKPAGTP